MKTDNEKSVNKNERLAKINSRKGNKVLRKQFSPVYTVDNPFATSSLERHCMMFCLDAFFLCQLTRLKSLNLSVGHNVE